MFDGSYRQIMYIRDGGVGERFMVVGTIAELAKEMEDAEYVDYEVSEVFGLDQMGDLKPLRWDVRGGDKFDDQDLAHPILTIHFPDGHRDERGYQIDGRS